MTVERKHITNYILNDVYIEDSGSVDLVQKDSNYIFNAIYDADAPGLRVNKVIGMNSTDLEDMPSPLVANKYLQVNEFATGYELVSSFSDVDFISFNLAYAPTGSEPVGTRYWDAEDETTSLVLPNGVILQDGQELHYNIQNDTGSTILNGKVVAYADAIGVSGKMRGILGIADGTMPAITILGIATADIPNSDYGKVSKFGVVRGINTTGASVGEVWNEKDILYVSTTLAGEMTNVMPQAPLPSIPIAVVLSVHAQQGSIQVRPTYPIKLTELQDVNGTPTDTDGQILVWDNTRKVFDFTANINDYLLKPETPINNDVLQYNSTTEKWENRQTVILSNGEGLYWGAGISGFYASGNTIVFKSNNVAVFFLTVDGFYFIISTRALMLNVTPSNITPVFIPRRNEIKTGLGGNAGEVSLISRGIEKVRATETNVLVGDILGSNYMDFEADGSMVAKGNATMWEDLNFGVVRSGGPVAFRPDDITINNVYYKYFTNANNQSCGDEEEIPHEAKLNSDFYPHAHGFLAPGESAGTTGIEFTIYWELRQSTGVTNGSTIVSATSAEITANPTKLDLYNSSFTGPTELGAQLALSIYRTGGNAGDFIVTTYGIHYEVDMLGSHEITTK